MKNSSTLQQRPVFLRTGDDFLFFFLKKQQLVSHIFLQDNRDESQFHVGIK